jgi:hypothetical protein
MMKYPNLALVQTAAAASALMIAGAAAWSTPATAQDSWDARHDVVRCDAGSDRCVVLNCDSDNADCVRMRVFHRDADNVWLHEYGFAPDYQPYTYEHYSWYGGFHVRCDADGDHCRRLPD